MPAEVVFVVKLALERPDAFIWIGILISAFDLPALLFELLIVGVHVFRDGRGYTLALFCHCLLLGTKPAVARLALHFRFAEFVAVRKQLVHQIAWKFVGECEVVADCAHVIDEVLGHDESELLLVPNLLQQPPWKWSA